MQTFIKTGKKNSRLVNERSLLLSCDLRDFSLRTSEVDEVLDRKKEKEYDQSLMVVVRLPEKGKCSPID